MIAAFVLALAVGGVASAQQFKPLPRPPVVAPQSAQTNGASIEELTQITMMTTAQDAQNDLRDLATQVKAANKKKAAMRGAVASMKPCRGQAVADWRRCLDQVSGKVSKLKPSTDRDALNAELEAMKREADALSGLSELSNTQIQALNDRTTRLMEMLSNLLKKMSDTSSGITANLK